MVIDANMYWVPETLFTDGDLQARFLGLISGEDSPSGYYGYLRDSGGLGEIVIEKPKGFQNLNYLQGEYQVERQLADMDAAGVDRAVLKTPCCQEWLDLELCRLFNDGMTEQARKSGGRLAALAVVPPIMTDEVRAELDRCFDELHMHGIQLSAHYGDKYLDDEVFAPLFAYLNERGLTAYIHHTPLPVEHQALLDYNSLRRSYGRCVDQMTAVCRELYSGMFGRYPNVRVVHSMLGGAFFALAPMMMPHKSPKETVDRFSNGNSDVAQQLRDNVFFELSHAQPWGKAQLECAVRALGADHILFGTSYPVRREWLLEGTAFIDTLDISQEDKERILHGNAERLYNL